MFVMENQNEDQEIPEKFHKAGKKSKPNKLEKRIYTEKDVKAGLKADLSRYC